MSTPWAARLLRHAAFSREFLKKRTFSLYASMCPPRSCSSGTPAARRPEGPACAGRPDLDRIGLPVVVVDVVPGALVDPDVEPVETGLDVETVEAQRDRARPIQPAEKCAVRRGAHVEHTSPVGHALERKPDNGAVHGDLRFEVDLAGEPGVAVAGPRFRDSDRGDLDLQGPKAVLAESKLGRLAVPCRRRQRGTTLRLGAHHVSVSVVHLVGGPADLNPTVCEQHR